MQLRAGTNGWVCMAHPEVMCLDKEWQGWVDAWMNKKDPQGKSVGIAYMLKGDKVSEQALTRLRRLRLRRTSGLSALPTLTVLTPDTNQLEALPTDPHNGGPWVMWKDRGTRTSRYPTVPNASEGGGAEVTHSTNAFGPALRHGLQRLRVLFSGASLQ